MTTDSTGPRAGQELIWASRPFAIEERRTTLFHVCTTLGLLFATAFLAAIEPSTLLRIPLAVIEGLLIVRGFILFHDVMHNALLRGSRIGRFVFELYGILVLTPATVWRATHNYHHAHTAKIVGSHVGSYAMLTVEMYEKLTPVQKFGYRAIRHPLNVAVGYLTIFLWGMCLAPFIRSPRKHWDGLVAFVFHVALTAAVITFAGVPTWLFTMVIPFGVAHALGGYLFYAQHNFPDIHVQPRESWEYTRAAVESSSYMEMGAVSRFFTGNIGYHHVHHLNPAIPFYRLPEAMAAIPELHHPGKTSLHPRDIVAAFRLKLWDPGQGKMVGYPRRERSSATAESA